MRGLPGYLFTRKGKYQTDNETYNYNSSLGTTDLCFHNLAL